jgi:prevent-host-death family protein
MTATEAARSFSDLLNKVAAGEEIALTRSGAEVAVISPPKSRLMSAERFRDLIATAPAPDKGFLDDVRAARDSVGAPEDAWQS